MKKIKSYTGIWNVEKVLYAINDFNLPFPVTFTQITWFVITEFIIILFGDIPPLSMIEGAFLKYFGIPVALTWFMSQKTFDGKKPYSFLKSQITYALRPKITYAGKAVKLHKQILNETITAVRSVNYVPDKNILTITLSGTRTMKCLPIMSWYHTTILFYPQSRNLSCMTVSDSLSHSPVRVKFMRCRLPQKAQSEVSRSSQRSW